MKFLKIEAKNFRQYRDLNLDLESKNNFLVLQANIGVGKTTFTNAILWCLYGIEQLDVSKDNAEPIPNESVVTKIGDGIVETSVSLRLELDDEARSVATIQRSQKFSVKDSHATAVGDSQLRVLHLKDATKGAVVIENPQLWVNRLLPRKLYPYFVFNGEEAANYFASSPQKEIKETILRIARVDVLERMKSHLTNVTKEIQAEMRKADPGNLDEAHAEVQSQRDKVEKFEAEIQRIEDEVAAFDLNHANLKERVAKSQEARARADEFEAATEKVEMLTKELKFEDEKLSTWVAQYAPYFLGSAAMQLMEKVIEDSKKKGTYPPAFKPDVLQSLLDRDECICGRSFEGEVDAHSHVKGLISEYQLAGPRGVELQKLSVHLKTFTERRADAESAYREIIAVIRSIKIDLKSAKEHLELLKSQGGTEVSDDFQVINQLVELLETREKTSLRLVEFNALLKASQEDLLKAQSIYDRAVGRSTVSEKLKKEYDFLNSALAQIDLVYQNILSGVLASVKSELTTNFKAWHSKENPEEIVLDEDFYISKVGAFGQNTSFSKGEYRLLYYALCFAARAVSGFNLPLIVDSPWGNMDNTTRETLARVLVEDVENRQTIVLVLDSEYPDNLVAIMAEANPRHLSLVMHSGIDDKYTSIEEVD